MDRPAVFDRIPPQNLEAEQSALASMILDRNALERVSELLKPEDFYREAHQKLFTSIVELYGRGEPVDLVTLSDELRVRGILDSVGGLSYITLLLDTVPTARNADYYAKIVEEKAILRRLIEASHEIAGMAYTEQEEIETIVDRAENLVFKVAQRRVGKYFHHLKDLVVSSWEQISSQAEEEGVTTGVPTGFVDLNYQTSGFQPSDLIILAARPSVGKTAFALNLAVNAAVQKGVPIGIFSLEMSKEQLALRMLCSEARVSSHRLRTGYPREGDWERIGNAMGRLSELPVFIDDSSEVTPIQMRSKLRRLAAEHGLGLVIIDYIQLISGSSRTENRNQELSSISRALKGIAKEFAVPVIALSQLSRAVEQRGDKVPMLSDLRDSGAIEQDADLVMFLHREKYYERDQDDGEEKARSAQEEVEEVEVHIAKHRNGPTGMVKLAFLKEYARFDNLAKGNFLGGYG
ncbi:MAG TPA: replicative DNA helicase [Armatimonadota bacterium]